MNWMNTYLYCLRPLILPMGYELEVHRSRVLRSIRDREALTRDVRAQRLVYVFDYDPINRQPC